MADGLGSRQSWPTTARLSALRRGRRRLHGQADAKTRAAIAQSLALDAVTSISIDLTVEAWLDGVAITGLFRASVTRICGVSLDPFEEIVDEPIALRLLPDGSPNAPRVQGEMIIDISGEDPPELVEGDVVDLAALLEQHLALALAPFPRKPGAIFMAPDAEAIASPFAALARLKPSER